MTFRLKNAVPFALLALVLLACGGQQGTTTSTTSQPAEEEAEPTMVRFVHSVVDAAIVDAYVGEWETAGEVGYRQWGDWVEIPSGEWDVTIRQGEGITLTDTYDFQPNQHYWIIAWGALTPQADEVPATFLIAPEEDFEPSGDDTWMRFANVVADGEGYGLAVTTDGTFNMPFPNQPTGTISEWKRGPIYENSFQVIPARDTSLDPIIEFDHNMQVGLLYTAILTGRVRNGTLDVIMIAEAPER